MKPCQDLSHAGKRLGLKPGTRSGLWSHMAYAISQLRPRYVIAENVRGLLSASADSSVESCTWCVGGSRDGEPDLRALGAVLGDLASLGYDARWVGLRAADIGAPHGRFRVFIIASDTDSGNSSRRTTPGQQGKAGSPSRPAADADPPGLQGVRPSGRQQKQPQPIGGGPATTDTTSDGRDEGRAEPAGKLGRPHAAVSGHAPADADSDGQQGIRRLQPIRRDADGRSGADVAWGDYEPAIRRWERVLGRPAPAPTETGPKGGQRLSPRFVEWMQGLDAGHVTDVPGLTRNEQLKALGNGVVPAQALEALCRALPEQVAA